MLFARLILLLALLVATCASALAQASRITQAVESEDWQTARTEIDRLRTSNETLFRENNYEYLLGRIAERTGDIAGANTNYQAIAARNSKLKQYALWRLAKI